MNKLTSLLFLLLLSLFASAQIPTREQLVKANIKRIHQYSPSLKDHVVRLSKVEFYNDSGLCVKDVLLESGDTIGTVTRRFDSLNRMVSMLETNSFAEHDIYYRYRYLSNGDSECVDVLNGGTYLTQFFRIDTLETETTYLDGKLSSSIERQPGKTTHKIYSDGKVVITTVTIPGSKTITKTIKSHGSLLIQTISRSFDEAGRLLKEEMVNRQTYRVSTADRSKLKPSEAVFHIQTTFSYNEEGLLKRQCLANVVNGAVGSCEIDVSYEYFKD